MVAVALWCAGWCSLLHAQEMPSVSLPGEVSVSTWEDLSNRAWPKHTADLPTWPQPIPSAGQELEYQKVSGSGYATTSGIYSGGGDYAGPLQEKILSGKVGETDLAALKAEDFKNIGQFQIVTKSAQEGLKTVAFLVRIKGFPPGEKFTPFELTQHVFPVTFSYNGGDQRLQPSSRKLVSMKLAGGFYEEIYALQWNLDPVTDPIRNFVIRWAVYPHGLTTGLRVDQSDASAPPLEKL